MSFNDIKNEADRSEASTSNVSSSLLGGDNLDAAEAAVAKLGSIMDDHANGECTHVTYYYDDFRVNCIANSISSLLYLLYISTAASFNHSQKRKSFDTADGSLQASSSGASNKKKKPLTDERREERNMREKERSLKITQQIHELRDLLSSGGVIVPKVRPVLGCNS
jgi:hypothetical protein